MTATEPAHITTRPDAPPGPSPRTRVLAAGMIAGPLLLLASTIATDDSVFGVLQMYAMAGMMLALVAITQLCAEWRPRFAAVVTAIGAVGIVGGVAYGMSGVYIGSGAEDLNESSDLTTTFALHLPGPILPLTFILMGVLLLASKVRPAWSGWALVAGGIVFPVSRIGEIAPLMPVPDILFLVGLVPVAMALWSGQSLRRG